MESIEQLQKELKEATPQEIIAKALDLYGDDLSISFSGAEDVILIDMARSLGKNVRVFSLDTGRLHAETYRFIEEVRKTYGIKIDIFNGNAEEVEALVKEKGLYSFLEDGHQECCRVRKVRPLRRALAPLKAWVTGQRKDQSPGTRAEVAHIEQDMVFGTEESPLVKFNPLANWTSAQVWEYIRERNVPYNPLHKQGYISIGCEPCTRPILPNQHEREGRWWWEDATKKECGLHRRDAGSK